MNILISNDDGIRAEGIARLAAAALPFGRVYVAAPQSQCSGMSQKLTIRGTLAVEQADFPVPVEAAWGRRRHPGRLRQGSCQGPRPLQAGRGADGRQSGLERGP